MKSKKNTSYKFLNYTNYNKLQLGLNDGYK